MLTVGDLRLEADRVEIEMVPATASPQAGTGQTPSEGQRGRIFVRAGGNVLLQRGDEKLQGDSLVLESDEGVFDAQGATIITPPFFIRGERVFRTPRELRAVNAHVSPSPNGRGEFGFRAEEIRLVDGQRISLRNATLYLWGNRLLTIRRVTFTARVGGSRDREARGAVPPFTVRASQISGYALGTGLNFAPARGIVGSVQVEATTKQGFPYSAQIRSDFVAFQPELQTRRIAPQPGGTDPALVNATPLRQLLTARALPPPADAVLDFESILVLTSSPLSRPTRAAGRDIHLELNVTENREVAGRRIGPALLSRKPEVMLVTRLPLTGAPPGNDNAAARSFLRRPRFILQGDLSQGSYEEVRLNEMRAQVTKSRTGVRLGIGTLPLLVGDNILLYGQVIRQANQYASSNTYRFFESTIAANYILGLRSAVGVAYIDRAVNGTTPFIWDQVDTQSEAQAFAQTTFFKGKYTLALLGRYDTRQRTLFDTEFAIAIRGKNIEPRISYRRLNGQLGFNIALPGLTTR